LDASKRAEQALPHAEAIARALGIGLELVHVVPFPEVRFEDVETDAEKEARQYLEGLAQDVKDRGVETRVRVLDGDEVSTAIIDYVEKNEGALVLMGTHGRTGLSKLAYGSVTERVLHEAKHTPVLVIRSRSDGCEGVPDA
jgi:nucleotide-binding universal stress UspA family protein